MPDWQKYGLMSGKNSTLASIQVIFLKKIKNMNKGVQNPKKNLISDKT